MDDHIVDLFPEPPVFNLGRRVRPLAQVSPGQSVRFHTTDRGYEDALQSGFDGDPETVQRLNALTGPVFVVGVEPGDALVVYVEQIEVGDRAFVVYVDRWDRQTFHMDGSWIQQLPIVDGFIHVDNASRIAVRPMIGCAGVAPASNSLSSLSPTGREGGNMDLRHLEPGSRLVLPIAVEGALFALGDLHAAMGKGEPAGAGFECAGAALVQFEIRKDVALKGPRIEMATDIFFLGTDRYEWHAARRNAISAAWDFLVSDHGVDERRAFALVSGLLHLEFGGPAGANVLARFTCDDLEAAGVSIRPA